MTDLLPCPFCGPGQSMVDPWFDDVSKRWAVGCGRCGASSGRSVHAEDSKEAAIKSWNTRGVAVTPQDAGVAWQPIWTAPHDGRLALVYRPLAENSGDQPVAVKRLIGGNHHCWESTVPKGDRPTNPTDGACHVTHWMQIQAPPPVADRQPENSICKFCARRVFEPCQSVAQAQNACTLTRADRAGGGA